MLQIFRQESGFYRRLWSLMFPIVLQNIISISLSFADTFMVGLLGNAEMAAVSAANTPLNVVYMAIFGFQNGMAVLVSQFWGQHDTKNISRCFGVAVYAITALASLVALACLCFPSEIMGLITPNPALIAPGIRYIRLAGFSCLFNSISSIYASLQRSTEDPTFGMALFTTSMVINTGLNYILIFGKLGLPALGIFGAALATLVARVTECVICLFHALRSRRLTLHLRCILCPGRTILRSFIKYSTPVICSETTWGLAASLLTVIMGHMSNSQDMLAANTLAGSIGTFATAAYGGVAAATAVIVGSEIGRGSSRDRVYSISRTLLATVVVAGAVPGLLLLALLPTFVRPVLFPLFHLTAGAEQITEYLILFLALTLPMQGYDMSVVTGVLRSGGDVKAAAVVDNVPLMLLTLPLMALLALVLDAPIWLICLIRNSECLFKLPLAILRYRSKKWINDVTQAIK